MLVYTRFPGLDAYDCQADASYSSGLAWQCQSELAAYPYSAPTPAGYEVIEGPPPGPFGAGYECLAREICYAGPQWLIRRWRIITNRAGYGPVGRVAGGQRLY